MILNGAKSKRVTINYGVPQGSVLGPILFILFINDLLKMDSEVDIDLWSFADDTALFFQDTDLVSLRKKAERGLKIVAEWFRINLLSLNVKKTKYVVWSKNKCKEGIKMHNESCKHENCNCEYIESVDHLKYLGIVIDDKLSWKKHIELTCTKLRVVLFKMFRLSAYFDIGFLKTVYHSLFLSVATYGIIVWGGVRNNSYEKIFKLQKRALRIVSKKNKLTSTNYLLKELDLLELRKIFYERIIIRYYRKNFCCIERVSSTYETRAKTSGKAKLTKIVKSLSCRAEHNIIVRLFNILPDGMRSIKGLSCFKSSIRKWIKSDSFKFELN